MSLVPPKENPQQEIEHAIYLLERQMKLLEELQGEQAAIEVCRKKIKALLEETRAKRA